MGGEGWVQRPCSPTGPLDLAEPAEPGGGDYTILLAQGISLHCIKRSAKFVTPFPVGIRLLSLGQELT